MRGWQHPLCPRGRGQPRTVGEEDPLAPMKADGQPPRITEQGQRPKVLPPEHRVITRHKGEVRGMGRRRAVIPFRRSHAAIEEGCAVKMAHLHELIAQACCRLSRCAAGNERWMKMP